MSETLFTVGEVVLYQNGDRFELGIVKSVCERRTNDWEGAVMRNILTKPLPKTYLMEVYIKRHTSVLKKGKER